MLAIEPSLADLPIHIVSSGTGEPLIDLAGVSPDLNEAAAGADLVILEGMGRGVESNLDAEFSCDAVNLAMIKDHMVAQAAQREAVRRRLPVSIRRVKHEDAKARRAINKSSAIHCTLPFLLIESARIALDACHLFVPSRLRVYPSARIDNFDRFTGLD